MEAEASWPTDMFILDLIWASVFDSLSSLAVISWLIELASSVFKEGSLEDVQQRI